MCFIEVDDLALNGQVMPVIQTKISFSIIGNKQLTINYAINYLYLMVSNYIHWSYYILIAIIFKNYQNSTLSTNFTLQIV